MKLAISLLSMLGLLFTSCTKQMCDTKSDKSDKLEGTWKMIAVKDVSANSVTTKPASIQKDVIITFVSNGATNGTFSGQTPTNDFGPNEYTLGWSENSLSMPVMTMTKVSENSWGILFVDHIREAQSYVFNEGNLYIQTKFQVLTFKRL